MKKIIALIILSAALFCSADNDIRVELAPKTIIAGMPAQLILYGKASNQIVFTEMPKVDGLKWTNVTHSEMRYHHNFYGRSDIFLRQTYTFIAEKEGTYTIPESWINVDGRRVKLKPITIHVKKMELRFQDSNGEEVKLNDIVFSKFSVPGNKKSYYVGEYIPLDIKVYRRSDLKIALLYPVISSGNKEVIYRSYQRINRQNPHFDLPRYGTEIINGKEFVYTQFRTEIKALATGNLDLKSQTAVELHIPSEENQQMTDVPFLGSYITSYQRIPHKLLAVAPVLEIKPLPPLPADTYFLGPIGNWDLSAKISSQKTSVGNAITLTLEIYGKGEQESIQPPELKLDGFRIYTPEVSRERNSAEIRYTLVPTKAGVLPISLKFCTFDPETGSYDTAKFSEKITVEAAQGIIPVQQQPNVVDADIPDPQQKKQEDQTPVGIMYLKELSESDSAQENYFLSWFIGIIAAGILFVIICEILAYLFRGTGTAAKRRADARRMKKSLLTKLEKSEPDEVYNLAPEISEYLNNALDLSPGTDLNESADWISRKNPELARELKNISAGAWVPGAEAFSEERKVLLMKMLKKLVCLVLFCLAPFLSAAEISQKDIIKAYDAGKFKMAREWYAGKVEKEGATPALLYNIGNCYYQEKNFIMALFCYERAHLLAPRDAEISRNLEIVRRDLKLPSENKLNTPSDIPVYLRDQMTPEEWMILAAAGIFFLLAAFGLRRFTERRLTVPVAIAGAIVLILGTAMTISQYQTTYNADRAIILKNGVQLRTLPSESANDLNAEKLKEAKDVQIRERRNKWIRIKAGNAVGWVPVESVGQLNGRKFSVF
ncbi:MAG: BatD family protein [Lentisphaeria bacterium]|nr:BatD family protein [Lentisphaeria bacterium]